VSQVILIEENQNLRDLLSINLKTYAGSEVIPRNNATEVIDLLNILPKIDLIITQPSVQGEDTAREILKYISTHDLEIGLIVNGEFDANETPNENLIVIEQEKGWEEIISVSASILGVTAEVLQNQVLPEYIPIEVRYFLPLDTSCCDVFIRIKKSPTEYQFIKRIHSGDKFSKSLVLKYVEQGLKFFYIPKDYHQNFTNFVSDHLSKKLDDEEFDGLDGQIELISQSYDIALKEITKLGFNSATIQLTDSIVTSMISSTKKSPEVNSVLHKIINSKSGYLYQHGHMSSIVACEIAKNLGLTGNEVVKKFAYASFFKDISFIENEGLAKITTFEELETAELNETDWDLVFNHPLDGALLIRKHPECPIDVDTIIKHHHGSQNGKGFSTINATKVPQVAKIFIIATEFVKELMSFKERGGKPTPIVDNLYKKYATPDMILIIKALEKTLKAKAKKK
jgi:HD-GYP domain-containing protein (c-di-GMP phosphodiesterase class II)